MSTQLQENVKLIKTGVETLVDYTNAILNHTDVLPYISLQYVQGNKAAYINTGIPFNGNASIEITFKNNINCPWAVMWSVSDNFWLQQNDNSLTSYGLRVKSLGDQIAFNFDARNEFKTLIATAQGGNLYDSNGNRLASKGSNITGSSSLYILGQDGWSQIMISSFKLYDSSGQLYMDAIPCIRKEDNKVCFYNLVNNSFIISSSNSDFIAGPEI